MIKKAWTEVFYRGKTKRINYVNILWTFEFFLVSNLGGGFNTGGVDEFYH